MFARALPLALVALCWVSPLQLAAQDSTRVPTKLCYRGRPAPKCQRFVVTEVGYYARVASTGQTFTLSSPNGDGPPTTYSYTNRDMGSQLTWEAGMMANRGPRAALGATLLLGAGTGGGNVGLKGRYRRWLTPDGMALDVGAGVISGSAYSAGARDVTGTGLTGDVALNAADYGAVVLRVDMLRVDGRNTSAIFGGVRLGSRPALLGTGALAVGFGLLLLALSGATT